MLRTLIAGVAMCASLMAANAMAASVHADYRGNTGWSPPPPPPPSPPSTPSTKPPPSTTPPSTTPTPPQPPINFQPGSSASWFSQIGLTAAIETQAKLGAGITVALVDTGVVANNPEVAGRVSNLSSCAAVTFRCSSGFNDDNGHGTATASILAGQYNSNDMMSGVAPGVSIVEEKVLNASGVGYDTDVANGITKAANAGAQVISISITYTPTAAVINAINYATSKGAVIVYAGGNSSTSLNNGVNTTGLSATALSHMIFVGSVNSANNLSSFSNKPGNGFAVAGAAKASYASLWLMAPGESIVAPGIQFGSNAYAYWSGTSMSAPEVAGAVALLDATWPVLIRNGTTSALLFASAKDLGAKGVDETFGNGLLNLTAAFQPVGGISVTSVNGQAIPVGQTTGGTMVSGAMGSMPAIKTSLSHYTTFDSFQRNFVSNLSGLVTSQSALPGALAAQAVMPINSSVRGLEGGGYLLVAAADRSYFDGPGAGVHSLMLQQRANGQGDASAFYMSLTTGHGATIAAGHGLPSTASFANAMWGDGTMAAYQANQLGVSNALMGLAQGGYFASVGAPLGSRMRLAASWSSSPPPPMWNIVPSQELPQSTAASVGLTRKMSDRLTAGVSFTALSEQKGLLGTTYGNASPLSFGDQHKSASIGATAAYNLGHGRALLFDATITKTSGAIVNTGLIGSVTPVVARAYGVSLVQADAFRAGDHLTVSLRKPLRVIGGSAMMAVTTVDDQGFPTTSLVKVGLRPSGNETDASVTYAVKLRHNLDLTTGLDYRSDAYNVRGVNDVVARLSMDMRF